LDSGLDKGEKMKTKLKDIFFKQSDSPIIPNQGVHVGSFAEANALLKKIVDKSKIGIYTEIVFTWEDGADLILRFNVGKDYDTDCTEFISRYLSLWSEGPKQFSAEGKKKFLDNNANPDLIEFCTDLKTNYQLTDERVLH
jgi:hypothetical protein